MKLLRVDYRLWLIGAVILVLVCGLYTWVFTQNHHLYPSKELTDLRNDYQKKLMDYVRARDECDEQFEAAVNGDWDNREKVLAARDKIQPARDKVIELGELSEEAGRKLRAAEDK